MLPTDFVEWLSLIIKHIGPIIVLIVGCFCIYALQRVPDLRSNPVFVSVRVLMIYDIIGILVYKIHDIPDEIAGRELFGQFWISVVVAIQGIWWFSQLLALPMVSGLHFLGIYRPGRFRALRCLHGYLIVTLFLSLSVLLTVPLLTECCKFEYDVEDGFWSFADHNPGTAIYIQANRILQAICVIIMLVCDVCILYKVYNMRLSTFATTLSVPVHGQTAIKKNVVSIRLPFKATLEKRLAMVFLLLSLSFILPTIVFNLHDLWHGSGSDSLICSMLTISANGSSILSLLPLSGGSLCALSDARELIRWLTTSLIDID